jgi:hypothetical protein
MSVEEIRIYASHSQFYVLDSRLRDFPDDGFWSKDASARRLAIADGIVGIGTGTFGFVQVRVEQHIAEPELNLSAWDHVTECNLEVRSDLMLVMGCIATSGLFFMVKPGHFRVRVCHANLGESSRKCRTIGRGNSATGISSHSGRRSRRRLRIREYSSNDSPIGSTDGRSANSLLK